MSDYTQWYNLDLYEGNDKPNLLDQYNTSMGKIDTALKTLQNQIHGGVDLEELEQKVYSLEHANHNYYAGKNVVFIGDSFTVGVGCSDYSTTKTKRFTSLVCQWLGATEFNFGVGSTGFIATGSGMGHNDPFITQVETANSSMSQIEKDNTAAVVIAGGINDASGATPTYNQMRDACFAVVNLAASYFPNAKVLLVPMMWKGYVFSAVGLSYYNALIEGGKQTHKCAIVEGAYTWNWGDSTRFNTDKIHPTDTGYAVIACNIADALMFGKLEAWEDHIYELSYEEGFSSTTPNQIIISKGIVYLNSTAVRSAEGHNANIRFATVPNCCAPEKFQTGIAGSSANNILGQITMTTQGYMLVNPAINAIPINGAFFLSPLCYKLYGVNYNA